ncbi:MAG: membrane protein insertion efficiency factor YidD [Pseudomonadota bacterium]
MRFWSTFKTPDFWEVPVASRVLRGRYSRIRRLGRFLVCAFVIMWGVPGCGHLREKNGCPAEAASHAPLILQIYQGPLNHLVAVRGGDCPMYPSCSEFCGQAIEKHGMMLGWMMTIDRLLRCGRDELDSAARVLDGDRVKAYDPVENNDYWWAAPSKKQ